MGSSNNILKIKGRALGRQRGFSLVEVSVGSLVFAIGLIGVAALQRLNIQETNKNTWQSVALQLANDYAERAKSNPAASKADAYVTPVSAGLQTYNCEDTLSQISITDFCSPLVMALADQSEFSQQVENKLPDGSAFATRGLNGLYQVTISWVDPAAGDTYQYQTQFVP